jgi:hypothetical protein
MRDLREYVDDYVSQLSGPMADDAWHSLVEAGPTALPEVVRAFGAASDPSVKAYLVQVISEYRSSECVPFLETLLRNPDGDLWKRALDGLVMIGGKTALDALTIAKVSIAPEDASGSTKRSRRLSRGRSLASIVTAACGFSRGDREFDCSKRTQKAGRRWRRRAIRTSAGTNHRLVCASRARRRSVRFASRRSAWPARPRGRPRDSGSLRCRVTGEECPLRLAARAASQ